MTALPESCAHLHFSIDKDGMYKDVLVRHYADVGGVYYNLSLADMTVFQTGLMDGEHFGNALSPYWLARALAKHSGMDYQMRESKPTAQNQGWYKSKYWLR